MTRLKLDRDRFQLKSWSLLPTIVLSSALYSLPVAAQSVEQSAEQNVNSQASTEQAKAHVKELPNPLTLNELLASYSDQSPEILIQQANIERAQAVLGQSQVGNSLEVNITGRLGRREFAEEDQDYNLLALHVGKVLYDFNQSQYQVDADQTQLEKEAFWLKHVENKQRLNIVKAYLNVLLADFQYRVDNEAMAIEYVGFDKVQDRHAVGQLSDVELLKAEHAYQQSLLQRMQAEQDQLQTRIELANVLDMPSSRPDELRFPKLKAFDKRSIKQVSLEKLQALVIENNPQIKAIELEKQAQLHEMEKAKNTSSPSIRADAWVGSLSSHPEIRDGSWKATLSIDMPLYDGGLESAAVKSVQSRMLQLNAQQSQVEQALRTQVADIYFQLKLLATEKKTHLAFGDYADLYLDYSRALYENESTTDLGDAMVRLSEANYKMVAWQFKQALLWLQLDYLLGQKVSLDNSSSAALLADLQTK